MLWQLIGHHSLVTKALLVTKGISSRSKKLLVAPGLTTSNKKLLGTKGINSLQVVFLLVAS